MSPEDIPFRPVGPEGEEAAGPEQGLPQEEPAPDEVQQILPPPGFGPSERPDEGAEGEPDEPVMSEEDRLVQVQRILEVTSETLADELRRSFDYYMSQESAEPISTLMLSGGGSLLPNLHTHLSQMFHFEVKMGDPTIRISENKTDLTDEELHALAPRLAIAIGLALEEEES
jgi:Tfp pilus assembly PilM family ATPase